MTLAALVLVPLQITAQKIGIRSQNRAIEDSYKKNKEANLLLGDSIMNFRTVQSFGHEKLIVAKFDEFMAPAAAAAASADFVQSCVFGLSQLITFMFNGALFGFAYLVMKYTDSQ